MTYQEEEQTGLRRQSGKQAIALAMEGRWKEAVEANQNLIESFPNDVDSYNRLGRAHMELGEYALARKAYEKTLEIDPYNIIAKKKVTRLSLLVEAGAESGGSSNIVEPQQFIEEVGKAGTVSLLRLAPPEILAKTVAGNKINLKVEGPRLIAENSHDEYLGQVEPRHGQRLIKLMEGGNRYTAVVVSSEEDGVCIMIREVYQDPSLAGHPSFPSRGPDGSRNYDSDRLGEMIIRRKIEYEETLPEGTSYAIVDGEEVEYFSENSSDNDGDNDDDDDD